MKNIKRYDIARVSEWKSDIKAGDSVLLSGYLYTARDAAHKRIIESLDRGEKLPFDLKDACIYYAGPTQTPDGKVIGSIGPTTSSRMDIFSPRLLDLGLSIMIGKGPRNESVVDAIGRNKALYFSAVGGAGAYIANCVKSCEVVAYEDLGCESVKRLFVEDFLVFCGIDTNKNSIFNR